ncbi:hypothetical protein AN960_09315 [Bacillus sp. FJAT-25509]|uniref:DUF2750 domain-containing protein n=1 Tax=Bacillus sp. FJAT-25509 TaxID=1712029 RepID=UPI0006F78725|nr:DUF2750 domain-containing protein [Bacillus sp. FJAT-25509]KQL39171.1 hypothetical protein AN960_09315 [Bacillus sp. FJAT-25509]
MVFDLTINSQKRYKKFIKRVIENGVVWGLECEDKWCVCESNEYEDAMVMPFWSDEAYARQCNINDWSIYKPSPIPLDIFMNNWLNGMNEDGLLVGINWNAELIGVEIEPFDLFDELEKLLEEVKLNKRN